MKLLKRLIFTGISIAAVMCSLTSPASIPVRADILINDEWFIGDTFYVNDDGVYGYSYAYVHNNGPQEEVSQLSEGTYVYVDSGFVSMGIEWASCYSDDERTEWYGMVDMKYLTKAEGTTYTTLYYSDVEAWFQCSRSAVTFDETYVSGNGAVSQAGHTVHTFSEGDLIYVTRCCGSMDTKWAECYNEDGLYCGYIDMSFIEDHVPPADAADIAADIPTGNDPAEATASDGFNFSGNTMLFLLGAPVLLLAITALIIILTISRTKNRKKYGR